MAVAIAISLAAFGALAVVTSSDLALPLPPLLIARQAVYFAASIDGWLGLAVACFAPDWSDCYCPPGLTAVARALAGAPPLTWLCRRHRCWLHVWQSTAASTNGWLSLAVARSV